MYRLIETSHTNGNVTLTETRYRHCLPSRGSRSLTRHCFAGCTVLKAVVVNARVRSGVSFQYPGLGVDGKRVINGVAAGR